jgi:hypothetical protein
LKENRPMSDEPKFDDLLRREVQGYRSAGEPPAAAMWSRIEGDGADAIRPGYRLARRWTWVAVGAGIAAALVVGVAIGRRSMTNTLPPSPSTIAASVDASHDVQLQAATMNHFVQAEIFLTEVRADLTTGRRNPERSERSRQLLARTRLLLANDAADAPMVERLLQDLELVLAEISAFPDSDGRSIDARLLDERLRTGTVLPRIRTILPSPPALRGT